MRSAALALPACRPWAGRHPAAAADTPGERPAGAQLMSRVARLHRTAASSL
jgi:hypothetical protein